MTPEQIQALKSYISLDPDGRGFASLVEQKAYRAVQQLLIMPVNPAPGSIKMSDVLFWIAQFGIKPRLQAAATLVTSPSSTQEEKVVGVLADSALDLILSPHVNSLDMSDVGLNAMFQGLVQAGIVPQNAFEALVSSSMTLISDAQKVVGQSVTDVEVMLAMESE